MLGGGPATAGSSVVRGDLTDFLVLVAQILQLLYLLVLQLAESSLHVKLHFVKGRPSYLFSLEGRNALRTLRVLLKGLTCRIVIEISGPAGYLD